MRMNRISLVVCLALGVSGCKSLITEDTKPTLLLNLLTASQYNHRGMVQVDDWVAQGDITGRLFPIRLFPADEGGVVTVQAWGNLNLTEDTGNAWFTDKQGGKVTEVDLKAEYSRRIGPVDVAAGVLSYILPNASFFPNGPRGTTTEIYTTVGGDVFAGELYSFYPQVNVHYDGDEVDGFYFTGGVSKAFRIADWLFGLNPENEILDRFTLVLNLVVGYSSANHSEWTYGRDDEGFADFRGTGTLLYQLDENTSLSIGVGGSTIIDSDIQDWFDLIGIDSENVWVTFGVGWKFF